MEPLKTVGTERFQLRFASLVNELKGFLKQNIGRHSSILDLCLVANSKSSSTKGCSVPPIIQLKQVKLNIRLLAQTAYQYLFTGWRTNYIYKGQGHATCNCFSE